MDSNFRLLGLTRSASQEDVRRAYKQKALQLHPDRNPGGAEHFKAVHEAYELVMRHLKSGRPDGDFINISSGGGGGGGGFASTMSGTSGGKRSYVPQSTPLFSEEELFRNINTDFGDFGAKRGTAGAAGGSSSGGSGAGIGGRAASWTGGVGGTAAGRPFRQRDHNVGGADDEDKIARDRAEATRRCANGERTAVPAYEPSDFDRLSAQRFAEMEALRARRRGSGGDGPPRAETPPTPPPRGVASATSPTSAAAAAAAACSSDAPPQRASSTPSSPNGKDAASASSAANEGASSRRPHASLYAEAHPRTRSEMQRDWEEARAAMRAEREAAEQRRAAEAAARRAELDRQTREEWERTQREMDTERRDAEVNTAMRAASVRVEEERAADEALRELAAQRRETRRLAFANMLPSASAVQKMTDAELFLLDQVLQEARELVKREQSHRRHQPCVVCSANRRVQKRPSATSPSSGPDTRNLFMCEHEAVCATCYAASVAGCPVCGAAKYGSGAT